MAQQRSLLAAVLLFLVALTAAAAEGDAPFVVAHKRVALSRPVPGVERLAVTLDLYNQGSATAYDVSLNDDSWPQEAFELVSGSTSKIVEKLDPGSTASHSFVLETKVQGRFQGSPAVIKYRVPTKAALQEAYSTPVLPFDILADRPPQKKFELVKTCWEIWPAGLSGFFRWRVYLPSREPIKIWCCKREQEETLKMVVRSSFCSTWF
ncbi:hypothetical protein BRADI_2g39960v3 [Brachypodium distachyon]|uniref:Translocon-associated protein subunit beta n=1 Tax=Brachypodium distachyon TaxID=15368 RepID=I1HN83_BRADI|nr:hypothetical protein BRADI_2g39960v3 [Brachypodium distachyon]